MITNIAAYRMNPIYQPKFTSNKEEHTAVVSYENFTEDLLNDLVEEWDEEGMVADGDSIFIMPQSHLRDAAKIDKKIAKTFPKANLSNNGFAVTLKDEYGKIHTEALRYFDPRVITILKVTHSIKNNCVCIIPIGNVYL